MTAQISDTLVNKHPRVKFVGLYLYGVIRGNPRTKSRAGWGNGPAFSTKPSPPAKMKSFSALWRGYVATFVLQPDGRLRLNAFKYILGPGKSQKQVVDELLSGDFWMVMKPEFFGQRTYVPFRDGVVVEDRSQWFTEAAYMKRRVPPNVPFAK